MEIKMDMNKIVADISLYDPQTFYENKIDKYTLEKIVDNVDTLIDDIGLWYNGHNCSRHDIQGTITNLKNFYKRVKTNKPVVYIQTSSSPQGRQFSKTPSLQGLPRKIRHTICKENYIDVDIKNCHPSILTNLGDMFEFPCDKIKYYIENRDKCLLELQEATGLSRDDVKTELLKTLNGGVPHSLLQCETLPSWTTDYIKQVNLIQRLFESMDTDENKEFKKQIKKNSKSSNVYNLEGKLINKHLCKYENIVIKYAINYCQMNGIIVASNQFDGLLLEKNSKITDEFLIKLSNYIKSKTGFDLKFEIKEMNDGENLITKLKELKTKAEIAKELKSLNELSDEKFGNIFVEYYKDNIKYHYQNDILYMYDDDKKLWMYQDFNCLSQYFNKVFSEYIDELIENLGDDNGLLVSSKRENYLQFKQNKISSTKFQKDVLWQVKNYIRNKFRNDNFIQQHFNKSRYTFPFQEKVFDFEKGEIRDRVKEDYYTQTTENLYLPDYDREWCRTYIRDLLTPKSDFDNEIYANEEHIDKFSLLCSSFFINNNTMKALPCFIGNKDGGKSLFKSLLSRMLERFGGDVSKRVVLMKKTESLLDNDLIPLSNVRTAFTSELKKEDVYNEPLLKEISGGDFKNKSVRRTSNDNVIITIDAKIVIVSNHMPQSTDDAFQSRLLCCNFGNHFERNNETANAISAKINDLFSYLCDYATQFVRNDKCMFKPSPEMIKYTEKEILNQDTLRQWFGETYIHSTNKKDRVDCKYLYDQYLDYCRGGSVEPLSKRDFGAELKTKLNLYQEKGCRYFLKTTNNRYYTLQRKVDSYDGDIYDSDDDDMPLVKL